MHHFACSLVNAKLGGAGTPGAAQDSLGEHILHRTPVTTRTTSLPGKCTNTFSNNNLTARTFWFFFLSFTPFFCFL